MDVPPHLKKTKKENSEWGYDDIPRHRYGYGNCAPQLGTLAGTMDAPVEAFLHEGAEMMPLMTEIIGMVPLLG